MINRLLQHCPACKRTARIPYGAASWGCACGITYTAQAAPDGTISVHWSQEGHTELLLAVKAEIMFPKPPQVSLGKRGRPARRTA